MLLVPGGRGAVSTASFWEVLICANTLKRSCSNGQENAQIDRCVLELWQFLCCWYLEEGETTITTLENEHHMLVFEGACSSPTPTPSPPSKTSRVWLVFEGGYSFSTPP